MVDLLEGTRQLLDRLRVLPGMLKAKRQIAADFQLEHGSLDEAFAALEHAVKGSFYPHAQLPGDECDGDLAHCNHVGQGCCSKPLAEHSFSCVECKAAFAAPLVIAAAVDKLQKAMARRNAGEAGLQSAIPQMQGM